jgi:hypothetical protein
MNTLTPEELRAVYDEAEASLRLEGMDPTRDPHYRALKARVIACEITTTQAKAENLEYYRRRQLNDALVDGRAKHSAREKTKE